MAPQEQSQKQQPPPQRPESPPYTTSDIHQPIEAYQRAFWQRQMAKVEEQVALADDGAGVGEGSGSGGQASSSRDLMDLFKPQAGQLPLARIKKVMKASDDQVKMISAEAPILFARACEIFIADLTSRSYIHATSQRRRTVQRSDVVAAVAGSNDFDFLVDIVPRVYDGGKGGSKKDTQRNGEGGEGDGEADADLDAEIEEGDEEVEDRDEE